VLAIAAAKLGWEPVGGFDQEPAALEAAAANAAANGVALRLERVNLREQLPDLAPTVLANVTEPLLLGLAAGLREAPRRLLCSGLLAGELEEVSAAFSAAGMREDERRREGDWAALRMSAA
jgi:ribosomal protein L11 methyltransferase